LRHPGQQSILQQFSRERCYFRSLMMPKRRFAWIAWFRGRRNAVIALAVVVVLAVAALAGARLVLRHTRVDESLVSTPQYSPEAVQRLMSSSSLTLRKKLELPFQLNFASVDLVKLLSWVEAQLDIDFRPLVDPEALAEVTVQASDRPLVETLCDVLSRRNMALMLQRDTVVIIPCEQTVKTTVQGQSRIVSFQMETQIQCHLDEAIELYCGDKAQYRLHLLAREKPIEPVAPSQRVVMTSLYVGRELKAFSEVAAPDGEWSEVPFPGVQGVALSLKPSAGEESALVLGVSFVYTQREPV